MTTPPLELVSHHLCPFVQRAVILLLEKEIPLFFYFDAMDNVADFGLAKSIKMNNWKQALKTRPSVQQAFSGDYSEKLFSGLSRRDSYLSNLFKQTSPFTSPFTKAFNKP